jgi:hypothetical protein
MDDHHTTPISSSSTTPDCCAYCGIPLLPSRRKAVRRFCSVLCKGKWQQTTKPVDEAWLRQKYLEERLSTYAIGALVQRNPKQVYAWLKGYGIPTRKRPGRDELRQFLSGQNAAVPDAPYTEHDWLYNAYVVEQRSAAEIAQDFDVGEQNILFFLKKFDIPRRTMAEARKVKYWGMIGDCNPMFGKRGAEIPCWKGGVTPLRQQLQHDLAWKTVAQLVRTRDQDRCQRCQSRDTGTAKKPFHIHHIVHYTYLPLTFHPGNLLLLCHKCHRWVHAPGLNIDNHFLLPIPQEWIERRGGDAS